MRNKSLTLNAIFNVIKQCLSVFFPLITYPYVSRALGADYLGVYSFSDSIIQILLIVSTLGIPSYAIREGSLIRDDEKAIRTFSSEIFTLNILSTILSYGLLLTLIIFVPQINRNAVILGCLSINFFATLMGRDWLNSIHEDFLYISIRYTIVHIASLILILIFVKEPCDLVKYVLIMAFSTAGGELINAFHTLKYSPYGFAKIRNIRKHIRPVLILFCSTIAITIYVRSDITMIGFLMSDKDVGIYTISSKVYLVVKSVLNAVITVTMPRLANYRGELNCVTENKYIILLGKLKTILMFLIFPSSVGLFCVSSYIMVLVGGAEFISGYISLRILSIALIFAVFGCFIANCVLVINKKEKGLFIASTISAIVNVVLNFIMIPLMGINGAALTTLISEFSVLIICIKYIDLSDTEKKNIFHINKKNFAVAAMECMYIIVAAVVLKQVFDSDILYLGVVIITSVIMYTFILKISKNDLIRELMKDINKRN